MMKDALFGGVNAAVLTPMRADLSVDLDRMAAHCRWLLANGCNNLGVLGTTGEANSIGISERIDDLAGAGGARHSGGEDDAGHRRAGADRYRAADQAGRRTSAAAAHCCCRRSITRTRPRMACSRISPR